MVPLPVRLGAQLGGRYRVEAVLGQGGAAVVFLGQDQALGRAVALKVLVEGGALADPMRFRAEAMALARLKHPRILELYDVGGGGEEPLYLVLELAAEGSLASRLASPSFDVDDMAAMAIPLLEALDFAHREGVLHRDLKTENVLITEGGVAKLSDFGLAKFHESGVRTQSGILFGTPAAMAPEVLKGEAATPASDIYAFGCLLYHVVNGVPPHTGSFGEILKARGLGGYPRGVETGPMARAIQRALDDDPKRRASATELISILRREPQQTTSPTVSVRLDRLDLPDPEAPAPARRRGLISAALLGILMAVTWVAFRQPSTAPAPPSELPQELIRRWRELVYEADLSAAMARVHARVFPAKSPSEDEKYPDRMRQARVRGTAKRPARLAELPQALEALPLRAELEADRARLEAALVDQTLSLAQRRALFETLQTFLDFDVYARSWGAPAVYRIEPLLANFAPWTVEPSRPLAAAAVAAPPTTSHRTRLFQWTEPHDQDWPLLIPEAPTTSKTQEIGWSLILTATGGRWRPDQHRKVETEAVLSPGSEAAANLRVRFRSFVLPLLFWVQVNDTDVYYAPDSEHAQRDSFSPTRGKSDFDAVLRLAPGVVRPGKNRIVFRARLLSGLAPASSLGFVGAWLELDPARGPAAAQNSK